MGSYNVGFFVDGNVGNKVGTIRLVGPVILDSEYFPIFENCYRCFYKHPNYPRTIIMYPKWDPDETGLSNRLFVKRNHLNLVTSVIEINISMLLNMNLRLLLTEYGITILNKEGEFVHTAKF